MARPTRPSSVGVLPRCREKKKNVSSTESQVDRKERERSPPIGLLVLGTEVSAVIFGEGGAVLGLLAVDGERSSRFLAVFLLVIIEKKITNERRRVPRLAK